MANTSKATKQAVSPISGVAPPKHTQFGQPTGNPRHNGAWKKEDTARFKLERMMELSPTEIEDVIADQNRPLFEIKLAQAIRGGRWKEIESMITQVYGQPKQTQDIKVQQVTPLVDIKQLKEG